ncbi:MAG: EndoU domain-containing protein [Alphaproteobacteria bacterium]|nr:EndoU domain-containing protein [Alphaproteobacteria bacterium]
MRKDAIRPAYPVETAFEIAAAGLLGGPAAAARTAGSAVLRQVVRGQRARPPQAAISADRRIHILDGDSTGGGHRPGVGTPGKSEFPVGWSDDKIINAIETVANDPAAIRTLQPNGRLRVEGTSGGIDIRVIIDRDGKSIWTAHPVNMPRNP